MAKELPSYDSTPFVDLSCRVVPGDADLGSLTMTHSSVNFDRLVPV